MSRYSDYQKKLMPWVNAKNFIKRHRVILIIIAASAFTAAAALTSTKGIVRDETIVSDHITYGDVLAYGSSAFMGKASYEFSEAKEDSWSSLVPSNVGEYKMRAKGENSFGGAYYGGVHYFTIDPYATACELASTTYTYGSKPSLKIDLCGGDKVDGYDIVYDDISKDSPTASIENLKITNSSGEDVTGNYAITFSSGEVTFNPLSVSINFSKKSFTYDQASHSLEDGDYTLSRNLVDGDELRFEKNSITDAGSMDAIKDGSIKILRDGEVDVTKHYNLFINYGSLTVDPAPVSLSSVSATKEYDGQPFSSYEYALYDEKSGLCGGDEIEFTFEDHSTQIAPGTYLNNFTYSFSPYSAGTNYKVVSETPGALTITKRRLSVSVAGTHTYAGSNFAGKIPEDEISVISGSLVSGHKLTCAVESEQSCLNKAPLLSTTIVDADGKDVTDCYQISVNSDNLFYQKKELTITAQDISVEYDGKDHVGAYEVEGLVSGDVIQYKSGAGIPTYRNVIDTTYTPDVSAIYSSNGVDRTKYYNVSCIGASFSIRKRPLTIHLEFSRDYAAFGASIEGALSDGEYSFLGNTSLAENHSINIVPSDIYLTPRFDVQITDEYGSDVTANYDYQLDLGSISFSKSTLVVNELSTTHTYNGKSQTISEPNISGLRNGDFAQLSWDDSNRRKTRVGDYDFTFRIEKIYNSSHEDVTKHYTFNDSYSAHLKIEKASPVTVTLITSNGYDGREYTPIQGTDYTVEGLAASGSDSVAISMNEDIYLNPKSTNYDVTITNSLINETVNDCYQSIVKKNAENIDWKPGALTVTAETRTVVYNGQATSASIEVAGLATNDLVRFKLNGQTYTANSSKTIPLSNPNVGTYPLNVEIVGVEHQTTWTKNWTEEENYYSSVTAVSGAITITKRPLNIQILKHGSDTTNKYSPYCYIDQDNDPTITGVVAGQKLRFTYSSNGDQVDYVPHIYDSGNVEVTSNYNITINGGDTQDRIPLTLKYKTTNQIYDAKSHSGELEVLGKPAGCDAEITLKDNPEEYEAKYAGESVTFAPEVESIKDSEGIDEAALYDVTTIQGTLTIIQRPITVSIQGDKTYNGSLFSANSLYEYSDYTITDCYGGNTLPGGDTMTITPIDDGTGSIFNHTATADDFSIVIRSSDGTNVTYCYDITVNVNFTFNKANVDILSNGDSFTYDGQKHSGSTNAAQAKGSDRVSIANSRSSEETEPGTYDYVIDVVSIVSSQGDDRSAYYNLPASGTSTFKINKRSISIEFPTYYNKYLAGATTFDINEDFNDGKFSYTAKNLPDGFKVKFSTNPFKTGPSAGGTYKFNEYIDLNSIQIVDSNGVDKTANFNINVKGSFVVEEVLDVTIWCKDVIKTYDGTPFKASDLSWSCSWLPSGYELMYRKTKLVPSGVDAGKYAAPEVILASDFYISKNGTEMKAGSYSINVSQQPTFEIAKCKMTFKTPDLKGYYMGDELELSCGEATLTKAPCTVSKGEKANQFLCNNGDVITLIPSTETYTITDPNSPDNPTSNGSVSSPWTAIVTRNGVDVTYNYEISFEYGSVTIVDPWAV